MTYFPTPYRGSIIGVRGLDFRVRNGNGYATSTIVTRHNKLLHTLAMTEMNTETFTWGPARSQKHLGRQGIFTSGTPSKSSGIHF